MSNWQPLFQELLTAESEQEALDALARWDLLDPQHWAYLGGTEGNFATVGNQHSDPTGALVEKIINAIDAKLLSAAFTAGIAPEGPEAPKSVATAVEQLFHIPGGRLGDLPPDQQRELASGIQVVALGSKSAPCYLIVDDGEGQTPRSFPDTFMSLAKSNKMRIPFVQGKFNSGGTGVLQFCGDDNLQLIASRRHPKAPVASDDPTSALWGFSIIRRIEPREGDSRRNSIYVYLAPNGAVPAFSASEIFVLPGKSQQNRAATPYEQPLRFGTVIKLYNYRWKGRSLATTEARFQLEKYLHAPALPLRITETRREYRANYYSTTLAGVWAVPSDDSDAERPGIENGFPASATLSVPGTGNLAYKILVFKQTKGPRRIPSGVVFAVNGQVHGELPSDFISRQLEFEYLRQHLLVSVDCTDMRTRAREDFFPAARDRVRRNEAYDEIVQRLTRDLKEHAGLRALNAARRTQVLRKALTDEDDIVKTLTNLLNTDPALRALFGLGDRLVTNVGPSQTEAFRGRRFPSYFRLMGDPAQPLVKHCPQNRTCRVRFETDASNDYFDRSNSPGQIVLAGGAILEHAGLWNGVYTTRWRPPDGALPGETLEAAVTVTDVEREGAGKSPFSTGFKITVGEPDHTTHTSGTRTRSKTPKNGRDKAPRLALPNIVPIHKKDWAEWTPPFTEQDALRVSSSGEGTYDYILNLDNIYLLTELAKAKGDSKDLVVHWFKYGLAIAAMGMLQHGKKLNGSPPTNGSSDLLGRVNQSANGLASVIVPIIRSLHRAPA